MHVVFQRWPSQLILKASQLSFAGHGLSSRSLCGCAPLPPPNRVYWLESGNIFRNLAFETTLFSSKTRYAGAIGSETDDNITNPRPADVLMWRSDPCVVIGRHQNAWLEANPREIRGRGWRLARRMSGGGAVFHDAGNLNISFVESRVTLRRRRCMEFLQRTLTERWPAIRAMVGPRYDLWLLPDGISYPLQEQEVRLVCCTCYALLQNGKMHDMHIRTFLNSA